MKRVKFQVLNQDPKTGRWFSKKAVVSVGPETTYIETSFFGKAIVQLFLGGGAYFLVDISVGEFEKVIGQELFEALPGEGESALLLQPEPVAAAPTPTPAAHTDAEGKPVEETKDETKDEATTDANAEGDANGNVESKLSKVD